jgi:AsmA-like protein
LLAIVAVVTSGTILSIVYEDEIIDLLKIELNKKIKSKLEVESIDLKFLKGFPNLSIDFKGVKFQSAFKDELLLESEHIYFILDIAGLFYNDISVERLEIENAKIFVHINSKREKNFDVFNKLENAGKNRGNLFINAIKLTNTQVNHVDEFRKINDGYKIESLTGSMILSDSIYQFDIISQGLINSTDREYLKWVINKRISLKTKMTFDGQSLRFRTGNLKINESKFIISGLLGFDRERKVFINLRGNDLIFSEVGELLPYAFNQKLLPFKSAGTIDLNATLEGNLSNKQWPTFKATFNLRNFEIGHIDLINPMKEVNVEATVEITDVNMLETGSLTIKKFNASINEKKIQASGLILNFSRPQITSHLTGELDVNWLCTLFFKNTLELEGPFKGAFNIDMETTMLLNKDFDIDKLEYNGSLELKNVGAKEIFSLPLDSVNGEVVFNKDEIVLSSIRGMLGESDFSVNGAVRSSYNLGSTNPIEQDAVLEVSSERIELDQIVKKILNYSRDSSSVIGNSPISFSFDLSLNIKKLVFRRFIGEHIKAKVSYNQKGLRITKLTSDGIGGSFTLSGNVSKQFNGDYYIKTKARTESVELDSLFYVFNNFNQNFMTDSVIEGSLNSEIYSYMYFDKSWEFKKELLYAEALLKVKKGELNNFEPIMSLATYLKNEDENLTQLRFSDLESSILISNDTVYISDMYIGSNVRNIKIGGYHTLDQHIDYRLSVPVSQNKKDRDERFGEVKENQDGKLYYPFRITGTTTNYKVNYDLKRASSNFIKSVGKELSEIGNSIKRKAKEQEMADTLKLEEDEFFDWDEN